MKWTVTRHGLSSVGCLNDGDRMEWHRHRVITYPIGTTGGETAYKLPSIFVVFLRNLIIATFGHLPIHPNGQSQ